MFPNVPLGLEQIKRTYMGYDALAEIPSPKLDSFVDLIEKSGDPPTGTSMSTFHMLRFRVMGQHGLLGDS